MTKSGSVCCMPLTWIWPFSIRVRHLQHAIESAAGSQLCHEQISRRCDSRVVGSRRRMLGAVEFQQRPPRAVPSGDRVLEICASIAVGPLPLYLPHLTGLTGHGRLWIGR